MDGSLPPLVRGLIAVSALVVAAAVAWWVSERSHRRAPQQQEPAVPPDVSAVLSVLRSSALVVGPDDRVLKASAPAHEMGLVHDSRVVIEELVAMVRAVRRDGQIRDQELTYQPGRPRQGAVRGARRGEPRVVSARVAPLGSRLVLAFVEDRTRERRLEEIRRDFVANISHELMTPIGALNVLVEAVAEAAEDPEAVQHFAGRMRIENERLSRLVTQIIELSRIQDDDPVEHGEPVPVDDVVAAALDRVGVGVSEKDLRLCVTGERGARVIGEPDQLEAALGNLVENAVAYSPAGKTVTVGVSRSGDVVDLRVTDQGAGIPEGEIERIFERFYRVDPARARTTGGTGVGLSIVKHVAAVHGGHVDVWSVEGEGSTFTISLPASPETPSPGEEVRP